MLACVSLEIAGKTKNVEFGTIGANGLIHELFV